MSPPHDKPDDHGAANPLVPDNAAGYLDEWVNIAALSEAMDGGRAIRKAQTANTFRQHREAQSSRSGDYAICRAHYYRKHGIPGRRYPRGPTLQFSLTKFARNLAMSSEIVNSGLGDNMLFDIDNNNCFVTLLINELQKLGVNMDDFACLRMFAQQYKLWTQIV